MTDNFKEIGSLFGREGAGAGFAKQTDKESFTYAFAWPEGDTWATLTGYPARYHSGQLRHFRGEPRLHLRQERARGGCTCKGCARKG